MLSRAACVPRTCLTCRLGLTSSRAALCARASPNHERWIRRRYYGSDPVIQSKERIEALIRGKGANKRSDKAADKHVPKRGSTPKDETESAPKEEQDVQHLETTKQEPLKEEPEPDEAPSAVKTVQHELIRGHQLGIEALGRPVDALIIKNPNKIRRPRKPIRMLEEEVVGPPIDLQWDSLVPREGESEEDPLEEALNNIDELRPVDTTVLWMKDFYALRDTLVDGFLSDQLSAYLRQKGSVINPKAAESPKYSWILKQGSQGAAKPDHREHRTQKQKHSIAIMRTIWNLDIREHVEAFGLTQVWLRPAVFQLIAQPSSSVLESLAAEFLYESNKEGITPSFDEARINIYSRKSTVPVILARLDEIVRSITSQKVSVLHLKGEDLLPRVLQELSRITKTGIQYNKQKAELKVSWFAGDDRTHPAATEHADVSGQTESPADVVLRLLTGREMRELQSTVQAITPPKTKTRTTTGSFVSHQRERRSMSWRDKLRQWTRYVSPVGKQSVANTNSVPFSNRVSLPTPTFEATQSETRNRIIATFGHVLHSKPERLDTKLAQNRRILSPVVPHPAAFTSVTAQDKPVAQHTAIILNFAPNPTQTTWFDGIVPEVRLRLPVDPDTDLSNFSFPPDSTLHGIVPWQLSDILLSGESVDVRLAQHRLLPLDVNQQSLKDFLAVCEFNLLQGRLRTPSQTTFSIPARWLSAATSKDDYAAVDIPYIFMGLEIHQAVEMELQGHTLRYNSIEAGQHGGQRQELSLRAGPPLGAARMASANYSVNGDDGNPLDEAEKTRFLQLVEEIAMGKHFSWHGGYQLMQERSDEQFSLDMMEEESAEQELPQEAGESEALSSIKAGDESTPEEPAKEDQHSTSHDGNQEASTTSDDAAPSSDSETTALDADAATSSPEQPADTTSPRTTS